MAFIHQMFQRGLQGFTVVGAADAKFAEQMFEAGTAVRLLIDMLQNGGVSHLTMMRHHAANWN
jgi:hypothetical protein